MQTYSLVSFELYFCEQQKQRHLLPLKHLGANYFGYDQHTQPRQSGYWLGSAMKQCELMTHFTQHAAVWSAWIRSGFNLFTRVYFQIIASYPRAQEMCLVGRRTFRTASRGTHLARLACGGRST